MHCTVFESNITPSTSKRPWQKTIKSVLKSKKMCENLLRILKSVKKVCKDVEKCMQNSTKFVKKSKNL